MNLQHEVPFKDDLIETEYPAHRYNTFDKYPSWIVKTVVDHQNPSNTLIDHGFFDKPVGDEVGEQPFSTKKLAEYKKLFAELRKFGINVPTFDYVIGCDAEGKENIFIVKKKINGVDIGCPDMNIIYLASSSSYYNRLISLDFLDNITSEQSTKLKLLLTKLFNYYKSKIESKGCALADLTRPEQYVYGRPVDEPEVAPDFYMIDLDPITLDFSKDWTLEPANNALECLYYFLKQYLQFVDSADAEELINSFQEFASTVQTAANELDGHGFNNSVFGKYAIEGLKDEQTGANHALGKPLSSEELTETLEYIKSYDFSENDQEELIAQLELFSVDMRLLYHSNEIKDKGLRYRMGIYVGFFHISTGENPLAEMRFLQKATSMSEPDFKRLLPKILVTIIRIASDLKTRTEKYFNL